MPELIQLSLILTVKIVALFGEFSTLLLDCSAIASIRTSSGLTHDYVTPPSGAVRIPRLMAALLIVTVSYLWPTHKLVPLPPGWRRY